MMQSRPIILRFHQTGATMLAAVVVSLGRVLAQAPAPAQAPVEDIRGPKPMIEIPVPEKPSYELWIGIAGGLLLALVGWFIWKSFRGRKASQSPPQVALAALAELENNREQLEAEAFANRAAQTVRQYIAARFGLAAPRRTTEEFLRELAQGSHSSLIGESDHLRIFLKSCDLAKFAGVHLDANQRGELVQAARSFVNVTATPPANSPSPATTP